MTIGERIKNRRKELGLSVEEVALRLGKNRAAIYRYESDYIESLPSPILEPLADVLQTTPAYLMGWEEEQKENAPINDRSAIIERINSLPDDQFEKFAAKVEGYLDGLEDQ